MEEKGRQRKRKRTKRKEGKKGGGRVLYALFGVLSGAALLTAALGLVLILLYKAGQARLMGSVEAAAPDAGLITDLDEEELAREKAALSTLQWQDNWVAIDGKVYAYDEDCVNLLFLGVDKKGKLSAQTDFENWKSGQTDAIFLASLNPNARVVSIVGIPRNSMVDVDIYNEENHKIDTVFDQICLQYAFAGGGQAGLERVKESVSGLFYGLPVHGAFAIGYDAVSVINDMAGGVDVEVLEDLQTEWSGFRKGERVHLSGEKALSYVRGRNYGQAGSPTLRLKRQKQYLEALAGKVMGELKKNPALAKAMYDAAAPYMNTDVTLDGAVYLAVKAADYRLDGDSFYLLEGEDVLVDIPEEKLTSQSRLEPFYDNYYLDEDSVKRVMLSVFYSEVKMGE